MHQLQLVFLLTTIFSSCFAPPTLPNQGTSGEDNGDLGQILTVGQGLSEGVFALLGQKIEFFTRLLSDTNFRNGLSGTVGAAINATGRIARVAVPAAQGAIRVVPDLIQTGSRFAGSLMSAFRETTPLIVQGITEFTDSLPLIAGFATSAAEVNVEQG